MDISHYLRNPQLILGMFRALPMDQLLQILTHEKVWAGNAMYTHHMDVKRKEFSGATTVYSQAGNRPKTLNGSREFLQMEIALSAQTACRYCVKGM